MSIDILIPTKAAQLNNEIKIKRKITDTEHLKIRQMFAKYPEKVYLCWYIIKKYDTDTFRLVIIINLNQPKFAKCASILYER